LRQEPDTQVEVVDGERGELTVLVDGREVARKGDSLPSVEEVKAAVAGAPTGAR
jgi:hypothetical protein